MTPQTAPTGRHVPLRRCVVCRTSLPKGELLRFYRDEAGAWQRDDRQRAGGRGAWICRRCAATVDVRALRRFFKAQAAEVAAQLAAPLAAPTPLHRSGDNGGPNG